MSQEQAPDPTKNEAADPAGTPDQWVGAGMQVGLLAHAALMAMQQHFQTKYNSVGAVFVAAVETDDGTGGRTSTFQVRVQIKGREITLTIPVDDFEQRGPNALDAAYKRLMGR